MKIGPGEELGDMDPLSINNREAEATDFPTQNDTPVVKKYHLLTVVHGVALLIMCIISAVIGYAAFKGQISSQMEIFQTKFDSIVNRMDDTITAEWKKKFALSGLLQKLHAYAVNRGYGVSFGQKSPYFTFPDFEDICQELETLSGTVRTISISPLLDTSDPSARPLWEAWAAANIASQTYGLPGNQTIFQTMNTTAHQYGIYSYSTISGAKERASDVILGGDSRFSQWLFPTWQKFPLASTAFAVFLDSHQVVGTRLKTIERILAAGIDGTKGALTDIFQLSLDNTIYRPTAHLYSLVRSKSPISKVIGLVTVTIGWDLLLLQALPKNLPEIDCVVVTKSATFTLSIVQGNVRNVVQGDLHESSMTAYGQNIDIDLSQLSPLSASVFTITIYPATSFFNQYNTSLPLKIGIAIAVGVFFFLDMIYVGGTYYANKREKSRREKEILEMAHNNAKKAETDRKRELNLRQELQENITNSAHDIKSPTTALGLAVDSLLATLDSDKPFTEAGRLQMVETLFGMVHTISSLTMIINRSVDASRSASTRGFIPNTKVSVDLEHLMDETEAFCKWQAEDTGIDVVKEPLPADLPNIIMIDEKWLKDDLLCVAGNAVKYSRANQKMPVVIRVSMVPSPTEGTANDQHPPSVQFSVIDSGYPLSNEKLENMFNHPAIMERTKMGGLGLGMYCLAQHVKALKGHYGARRRIDGREGTEIWFSFPLIEPEKGLDQFVINDLNHSKRVPGGDVPKQMSKRRLLLSAPQNPTASVLGNARLNRRGSSIQKGGLKDCNARMGGGREDDGEYGKDGGVGEGDSGGVNRLRSETIPMPSAVVSREYTVERLQKVLGTSPILLVDDAVSILKMTKRAIQNECANVSVLEAKNGEEAFERVVEANSSIKVILTDIQMPICDGFEFTRQVRQWERDNGLPPKLIIGISANDQEKIYIEAKECGMDGFMRKPFKLATLIDILENISDH